MASNYAIKRDPKDNLWYVMHKHGTSWRKVSQGHQSSRQAINKSIALDQRDILLKREKTRRKR